MGLGGGREVRGKGSKWEGKSLGREGGREVSGKGSHWDGKEEGK